MNKMERAKRFFPRDELIRQIETALLPHPSSKSQPKTCVMYGPHGIGKTEIAIEFAYQRKNDYDAVFFLSAATQETIKRDYCLMAEILGFSTDDNGQANSLFTQERMVLAWLKRPLIRSDGKPEKTAKWLMILDNLDDITTVPLMIPQNGGAHGALLITTVHPMPLLRELGSSTGLEVPFLGSTEAADFLEFVTMFYENISEFDMEEKTFAENLVKRLGGKENLPFVLGIVAGILITSTRRKDDLKYFTQNHLSDPNRGFGTLFTQRISNLLGDRCEYTELASAWALVRNRVRAMADGPNRPQHRSERLLNIFALLDRTSIPSHLFTPPSFSGSTLTRPPPKTSLVPSDTDWHQTLTDLESLSLIARTENRGLRLHRITVDSVWASIMASDTTIEIEEAFAEALTLLKLAWPHVLPEAGTGQGHSHSRWKTCLSLLPHIMALKESYLFFQRKISDQETVLGLVNLLSEAAW